MLPRSVAVLAGDHSLLLRGRLRRRDARGAADAGLAGAGRDPETGGDLAGICFELGEGGLGLVDLVDTAGRARQLARLSRQSDRVGAVAPLGIELGECDAGGDAVGVLADDPLEHLLAALDVAAEQRR